MKWPFCLILERTLENLLLVAHAVVAIENPDDISIISFRKTGQLFVVRCLLLPLEPLLLLVALLLEPSLTGSRQPMGAATSGDYWSQGPPPASFRGPMLILLPLLCVIQKLPTAVWLCHPRTPPHHTVDLLWRTLAWEVLSSFCFFNKELFCFIQMLTEVSVDGT